MANIVPPFLRCATSASTLRHCPRPCGGAGPTSEVGRGPLRRPAGLREDESRPSRWRRSNRRSDVMHWTFAAIAPAALSAGYLAWFVLFLARRVRAVELRALPSP